MRQNHCIRCGTCCEKGGPALHREDLDLVLGKKIAPEALYTIRRGELVHDNVAGGLRPSDREIIKVRSAGGQSACLYYDSAKKACRVYADRPLECRVLACWDTGPAEALYKAAERLDRSAVFGRVEWITDLIRTHEKRCGYEQIAGLAEKRSSGDAGAGDAIAEIVRYDTELRRIVGEKTGLDPNMLDLVFGRRLEETVPAIFGIRLVRVGSPAGND